MKLLGTISNWKRTGPVEPSLDLARAVADAGHDVRVAVGRSPAPQADDAGRAREARGLADAAAGTRLAKHAFFLRDRPDVRRLVQWMRAERPDACVTTLANDHRLVLAARRRLGVGRVIRLYFGDAEGEIPRRERSALLESDGVLVFGEGPRRRLEGLGIPPQRLRASHPPLDVRALRASAARGRAHDHVRDRPPDGALFGVVARMQTHRAFEVLWQALGRLVAAGGAPFRLLAIGRGTHAERVAHEPVRRLGLEPVVSFPGYLRGDEYAATLASLDAQIFLVPGSDPTCRALREGMALGVPSVAARRGLLPEIVADGETGLLFDGTVEGLLAALRTMGDPETRRRLGAAARRRAETLFAAERVAADLIGLAEDPRPRAGAGLP
jgi:glycosyltransferase involved in cell wall biosynthesis